MNPGADDQVVSIVVSRFPKFTETFVVNEILALERCGWRVEIHPLLPVESRPHQSVAGPLVERARFGRAWGFNALRALVGFCWSQPAAMRTIVMQLVSDTWSRPTFMVKDFLLLPRICAIAREMRLLRVRHVHAHFATHAGFAAWVIGRLTGLPFSIVAHGSDVHRHQAMLATKVADAAFVTTVSEFNRQVILSVCGDKHSDRVLVERMGVDLRAVGVAVASTKRAPTHGAHVRVLCVGSLHEVKGQEHLIRAMSLLASRPVQLDLELIGDGDDREQLESLVESLGLLGRVQFSGAVDHAEVLRSYVRADIVVAPSVPSSDGRKEGIPTVLVEAMAAGVPVIASDLAGIGELVRHEETGLLVPPGDHAAVARAIELLVVSPDLVARLRNGAKAHVLAHFDLERTTERMAELMANHSVDLETGN